MRVQRIRQRRIRVARAVVSQSDCGNLAAILIALKAMLWDQALALTLTIIDLNLGAGKVARTKLACAMLVRRMSTWMFEKPLIDRTPEQAKHSAVVMRSCSSHRASGYN